MQHIQILSNGYTKNKENIADTSARNKSDVEEIYARHAKTVYRVCYMYAKNKHDSEDLLHTTFVKLMNSEQVFSDHEHEKAWLIRVADNLCKDFVKSAWSKRDELPSNLSYADNTQKSDILELVMGLPEKYKVPIYLHYYEGYKTHEIAKMLDKSESTVRGLLHRGRKMLKIELEREEK